MNIDVESLLRPISDESECGENLEYDPAFLQLGLDAAGTPEKEMGDSKTKAVPPDWNAVLDGAVALCKRTKDLRVAALLLRAALDRGGLPGFASGLKVLNGLLSRYWADLHPALEKEGDADDATLRINSLAGLDSHAELVGALERCPLVESRQIGRFALRDIKIAAGNAKAADSEEAARADPARIDAAFLDAEADALQVTAQAAATAADELHAIQELLDSKTGSQSPENKNLTKTLSAIRSVLADQLGRRGIGGAQAGAAESSTVGAAAAPLAVGGISSRDDVVRVLDQLCHYFDTNEPSSPVPLLLRRAQRLVAKDFMTILKDLTPDSLSQARLIGGLESED